MNQFLKGSHYSQLVRETHFLAEKLHHLHIAAHDSAILDKKVGGRPEHSDPENGGPFRAMETACVFATRAVVDNDNQEHKPY